LGGRVNTRASAVAVLGPPVRLRLLDGFALDVGGEMIEPTVGLQRLIALVALRRHALHRDYAAGLLWLDVTDRRAAGNLRSALWRLRQLVGRPVVVARGGTIRLHPDISVDVHEASASARRWVGGAVTDGDVEAGAAAFESDLLPDWYDEWVVSERECFRQLRLHALEAVAERYIAVGRLGDALLAAMAAVAADPLRETAHRALIRVHLAEGNAAEAIRQVRRCERLLRDELGVYPSTGLTDLVAASHY
jgi:DNA-binding SARP family transcriptional activator